ncbi:MAG TPA: hypothetical protein PKA05_13220 [Roseiflexaceae bacterium]|nr:hypothetical protein [Roseiflexaceae bacterium]HMP41338.1 hypothetical protein [Roseiflexaceae bacterium]
MTATSQSFGNWVSRRREALGLTQAVLASMAAVLAAVEAFAGMAPQHDDITMLAAAWGAEQVPPSHDTIRQ